MALYNSWHISTNVKLSTDLRPEFCLPLQSALSCSVHNLLYYLQLHQSFCIIKNTSSRLLSNFLGCHKTKDMKVLGNNWLTSMAAMNSIITDVWRDFRLFVFIKLLQFRETFLGCLMWIPNRFFFFFFKSYSVWSTFVLWLIVLLQHPSSF